MLVQKHIDMRVFMRSCTLTYAHVHTCNHTHVLACIDPEDPVHELMGKYYSITPKLSKIWLSRVQSILFCSRIKPDYCVIASKPSTVMIPEWISAITQFWWSEQLRSHWLSGHTPIPTSYLDCLDPPRLPNGPLHWSQKSRRIMLTVVSPPGRSHKGLRAASYPAATQIGSMWKCCRICMDNLDEYDDFLQKAHFSFSRAVFVYPRHRPLGLFQSQRVGGWKNLRWKPGCLTKHPSLQGPQDPGYRSQVSTIWGATRSCPTKNSLGSNQPWKFLWDHWDLMSWDRRPLQTTIKYSIYYK